MQLRITPQYSSSSIPLLQCHGHSHKYILHYHLIKIFLLMNYQNYYSYHLEYFQEIVIGLLAGSFNLKHFLAYYLVLSSVQCPRMDWKVYLMREIVEKLAVINSHGQFLHLSQSEMYCHLMLSALCRLILLLFRINLFFNLVLFQLF